MLWDALKAAIRGETLSYALRRKKQRHLVISAAQIELASLESQIVGLERNNAPIQDTLDKIAVMKAKIIQLYLEQDIIKAQIRTQECYEFSERVGKVLAYKTRQKAARSAILAIKDRMGQIVYGDTSVLQVFKEYYSILYQPENLFSDDRDERIAQYLSDMSCPKLSQDEGCQLTAPIELDEIISALTALSNGKATGSDMIPIEFFKTFFEELKDDILALFTSVQAGERVPGSWLEANIITFLKKEKNPLLPGSYRPISLLNADAKWCAKILAVRLSRVIGGLVSPWQHGFIPGRGTTDHVRRVITMLDASQVMAGRWH
ncbi:hypothetical protein NDU88_005823 [Pleurodeles waltl]|uniref:Reverse transcriptase domain-containing protein n=1 Tax=Pleurodeles waltl TaxID=8319 RepID=A0AAV7RN63_PLEWA|nr:hypothetical protein NDU88_005823 [Pleurodeles waltl]